MDSMQESYVGLYISLALLVISTLVVYYLFALIGELFKYVKARIKRETYHFSSPNPFRGSWTDIKMSYRNKVSRIKMAKSACKDISWFLNSMMKNDQRTSHAFIAYSLILFLFGVVLSDIWDYTLKTEWLYALIDVFKAIL